jgi:hypothetical protein
MKLNVLIVKIAILTFLSSSNCNAQSFQIDDTIVGTSQYRYNDPEFLDGFNKAVWIDRNKKIWVGNINPVNGLFFSVHGQDILIDSNVVPIDSAIINGPEWGTNSSGGVVFYTKRDLAGKRQIWRANLSPTLSKYPVTSGTQEHIHWYGTLSPSLDSMNLFFVRLQPYPVIYWCNENLFNYSHPILNYNWNGNNGPRFIPGKREFVYSKQIAPGKVELVRVNMVTNTETIVTNDSINKVDTWGFAAAEYNNEILYCAKTSDTTIGIYRYVNTIDPYASRIATLRIPIGDPHKYISSTEPLQGISSVGGISYFTVLGGTTTNQSNPGDGSLWVLGLGTDPNNRITRRVDEGAVSGNIRPRIEPEPMIGTDEVFLYYNSYNGFVGELRRARTGIKLTQAGIKNDINSGFNITVYPIPAKDVFFISGLNSNFKGEVFVYDSFGRLLFSEQKSGSQININVGHLNAGLYFIQLKVENGQVTTKKIIKE